MMFPSTPPRTRNDVARGHGHELLGAAGHDRVQQGRSRFRRLSPLRLSGFETCTQKVSEKNVPNHQPAQNINSCWDTLRISNTQRLSRESSKKEETPQHWSVEKDSERHRSASLLQVAPPEWVVPCGRPPQWDDGDHADHSVDPVNCGNRTSGFI